MSLRLSSYAMADVEILLWLIMTFITLTTCTSRTTHTSWIFTFTTRTSGECWTWLFCADNKLTILLPKRKKKKKKIQAHLSQSQPNDHHWLNWNRDFSTTKRQTIDETTRTKSNVSFIEHNRTLTKKWSNRTQSNFDWMRLGWMAKLAYIRLKMILKNWLKILKMITVVDHKMMFQ